MNIMANESSSTSPLYLCQILATTAYWLSDQADCEGHRFLRQLGYMTQLSGEGSVPLVRCQSNLSQYSLFTILPTIECTEPAWSIDRTIGFVRSPPLP